MLTKAQGDEMPDDLKRYGAVDIMDNWLRVFGAVCAVAAIGMLIVVALGWTA